ncbi:MAG: hypothetical protein LBG27_09335 [Spirochaetaceae bacterium]|jgi:hypothetical protein|nr:hypothetical protein [Spirochaetaceae bacterium]
MKPGGRRLPIFPLITALFAVLLFVSCSGRITGAVQTNEQGEFIIEAELAPASARLLAPFSPSAAQSAPVLDAGIISRSLQGAPGVASARMLNTSPENIAGSIGFTKISDFLMAGELRFITWDQGPASGRAVITIDRSKGPQMIAMLSQDVADYLSAVMAPIATGEPLSKTEYLRLVSSVYGSAIAREIENAEITASISFPGHITMAQGGDFSGSTARFRAKLLDLLVLEQPLGYEVRWTPFRL